MTNGRPGMAVDVLNEMWARHRAGETRAAIAEALGRPSDSIYWLIVARSGVAPLPRRHAAQSLTSAERETISPPNYLRSAGRDNNRCTRRSWAVDRRDDVSGMAVWNVAGSDQHRSVSCSVLHRAAIRKRPYRCTVVGVAARIIGAEPGLCVCPYVKPPMAAYQRIRASVPADVLGSRDRVRGSALWKLPLGYDSATSAYDPSARRLRGAPGLCQG